MHLMGSQRLWPWGLVCFKLFAMSYVSYLIFLAAIGPPPTQLLPPTQTPNDTLIQDPPTISQGATPNTTKPTTPIRSLSRVHALAPGRASPVLNQQNVASQVPAPTQRPNIRSLAQPLAPGWGRLYGQANQEKLSTKNLKIQNHELDEQRKRTCTLVLYHTVSF